ncbi:MAG: hypothetical protein WCZ86_06075 [Desulfurivibrionaceae bacterium]
MAVSYLVPASELDAGGFIAFGSGASNVARINTAPTSDTSNGVWADTMSSEDPCYYQLTVPTAIDSAQPVSIGVIACGDYTEDSGTYAFNLKLKYGGAAGTLIATHSTSRPILGTGVFTSSSLTLSGAEAIVAAANASDLCLGIDDLDSGMSVGGGLYISEIWLEYTESGGDTGTRRRTHLPVVGAG